MQILKNENYNDKVNTTGGITNKSLELGVWSKLTFK